MTAATAPTTTATLRVGLYGNGRAATEVLEALPAEFTLTKSIVFFDEQNGQDIGTLTGGAPIGVVASTDLEEAIASGELDVLIYTGLSGDVLVHAMRLCAEAGVDLVHACFVHPRVELTSAEYDVIERAAIASGARIVGTGMLPGLWLDVLPSLLTSALAAPVTIHAASRADITSWGAGVLAGELGIGELHVDEPGPIGPQLQQSALLIAEVLGIGSPLAEDQGGFVVADTATSVAGIDVDPGDRVGFDQSAVVFDGETERIRISWKGLPAASFDGFVPGLEITATAADGAQAVLRIDRPADPYPGTAARLLHAVRGIRALPGGLHTPVDLCL